MMEPSLKLVRTTWLILLASVVFYAVLAERLTRISKTLSPPFYYAVVVISVFMMGSIFVLRRLMFSKSEIILAAKPDDKAALVHWMVGQMVTFGLCEVIALFGLVFRVTGSDFSGALPFYIAGFLLMLYFAPRRPSNAIG